MRQFLILFIFLFLPLMLWAGLSLKNTKNLEPQKTAEQVQKTLEPGDVSSVSARIKVEGAQFRPFNLFLPPCELDNALTGIEKKKAADLREVLERDLAITGSFNLIKNAPGKLGTDELLKAKGAEGVSRCKLSFRGPKLNATINHKNLLTGIENLGKAPIEVAHGQYRRLAHLLAQSIFEEFIGPEDLFLLQIAAVKRSKNYDQIVMFDFDGYNENAISSGTWSKASPYFAPDGKSILYAVTTDSGHGIVEQIIGLPTYQFRTNVSGLNIDPRVLPDNKGLLVTLTFGKIANIYKTTRSGDEIIGPVAENLGMNLSPTISPDGKMMAFVSTRGGSAQIYEQALPTAKGKIPKAVRLTDKG